MYIEPYWCGVISTLLVEAVVCAMLIAIAIRTNLDDKEDETNEE